MKRLFTYIIAISAFLSAAAETVSQKQAQQLAHLFFNEVAGKVTAPPKLIYNGKRLTTARLFTPFYVYNTSLGGFVIISAENKAFPILGFSLKDNFDPEQLGETETALMQQYAREIEFVRYDTEPVDGAIWAWQHYPEYVDGILKAAYIATDPLITTEEAYGLIESAVDRDDAIYSDIYTPEQWRTMIIDELALKQSAPLGIIGGEKIFPAVVYGRQGDYFRIEMTKRNSWLMRLNATEAIPSNMVTLVVNPIYLPLDIAEELPFEIHDSFIAEVAEIESGRTSKPSIDSPNLSEERPLVKANGSGHFEIILPENVRMVTVYNLAGAIVRHYRYSDTQSAHIDLSAEPFGFYIVNAEGESGTPYGMKLYR